MSARSSIDEADLHALVDNELSGDERRRVEDHLLEHPESAALVELWRRQNAALRAAFEPVARETPPLSLRNAALRNAAPGAPHIESGAIHWGRPSGSNRAPRRLSEARASRRARGFFATLAALIAGAAIAGAAVFLFTRGLGPGTPAAPALQGYVERAEIAFQTYVADPKIAEFDAAPREELLGALQTRLGLARVPDLSAAGFRLLGARVTPGVRGPAALVFYEKSAPNERIALYYERADALGGARLAPRLSRELTAVEWRAAGYAFVLIGPLGAEAIQQAAESAAAEILTGAGAIAP